jgi:hypothetical protein
MDSLPVELINALFPKELRRYFNLVSFDLQEATKNTEQRYVITFEEKNELPEGFSFSDYETKDFYRSKLIQDFPLRGIPVFFSIKRRRWRHKTLSTIISRDFTFIAHSSKFTQDLSDFLKECN